MIVILGVLRFSRSVPVIPSGKSVQKQLVPRGIVIEIINQKS